VITQLENIMHMTSRNHTGEIALKLSESAAGNRAQSLVRSYVITMRPYLLFISGITGIAGLAFSRVETPAGIIAIFVASFLSYGFGQALTDCFQIDTDTLSSPYRPLTQGAISRRFVMLVSWAGLAATVALFALLNPSNLILGCIAGAGLATYTWFKRRWWGGPFYNAWIVVLLFVMGTCTWRVGEAFHPTISAIAAGVAVFFGYTNFVLAGYFKDIEADRATGYLTLPVVAGRKVAAIVSDMFAGASVAAAGFSIYAESSVAGQFFPPVVPVLFIAAGFGAAFAGQIRLHRVGDDAGAHRAITPGLYSYMLILAGIACCRQPAWIIPLLLFIATFHFVLGRRPVPDQV
jgi:4-hydroxybenzoate polyprenyltransferase